METEMKNWNYKIEIKINLKDEFPDSMNFDDVEEEVSEYLKKIKVFLEDDEIQDKKIILLDLEEEL